MIKKEYLQRELAQEITYTDSGVTESLTYIGSGSNCHVYKTSGGDIIKEFAPVVAGFLTMSRKDSRNAPLTIIESLPESYKDIVFQRRERFLNERIIVEQLNREFCQGNNNMFISPEFVETSLGVCQRYKRVSGEIFSDHLDNIRYGKNSELRTFEKRFRKMLPYLIKLFRQVEIYHNAGFLNLDIKPDNLIVVNFDSYEGIRNIDFGSAMKLEDIQRGMEQYAKENCELDDSELYLQISSKYFSSSAPYYNKNRIERCIISCLDSGIPKENKIRLLKQLDIIAAWKTMLYAMCEGDEEWYREAFREYVSEWEIFEDLFFKLFKDSKISGLDSLFADYNIFFMLYEISKRVFTEEDYFWEAGEICEVLEDILCIVDGIEADGIKSSRQLSAEDRNKALMNKDKWLEENGLFTISDILEYCVEHSTEDSQLLSYPVKPGALYLHLLVNLE